MTSKAWSDSFWDRVDVRGFSECWPWKKAVFKQRGGYGAIRMPNGKTGKAHRVAYELWYGAPKNHVLHHCDNPICCNPFHLFDGTNAENIKDRNAKGRRGPDTLPKGVNHWSAKLTPQQVKEIRTSTDSSRSLARQYKTSKTNVLRIKANKIWRDI